MASNFINPFDPGDSSIRPDSFAFQPPTPPSGDALLDAHSHALNEDIHSSNRFDVPLISSGWEGQLQSIVFAHGSALQQQQEDPQDLSEFIKLLKASDPNQEQEVDPVDKDFMRFMRGDTEEE